MENRPTFKALSPAEVDLVVARAQDLRAQYIGKWIRKAVAVIQSARHPFGSVKSAQ